MDRIGAVLADTKANLKGKMWNMRFFAMALILVCMMDMYLETVRRAVSAAGGRVNFSMLPFLWNDVYSNKILFLLILMFYSNVPFMEKNQIYVVMRTGRERFFRRNMVYILLSSLLLNVAMAAINIAELLPVGEFSNEWTRTNRMLALTDAGSEVIFSVPYGVMKSFSPWELFGYSLAAAWLVTSLSAMLMYVVSLWGGRVAAYGVTACFVLMPQFISQVLIMYGDDQGIIYFTPAEWVRCERWGSAANLNGPDMIYIVVACALLWVILGMAGSFKINKMDFKSDREE